MKRVVLNLIAASCLVASAFGQGTFPNTVTASGAGTIALTSGTHGNRTVLLDCTGGDTVTVPSAADTDFMYFLKRTNSASGDCTIDPAGTEEIDGSLTYLLTEQNQFVWLVTDGSNWHVIDKSVNFANEEGPAGTIDGANDTFTLSHSPSPAASLVLLLNGVTQRSGAEDFALSGNTITFTNPPIAGDTLACWYQY